jgi:hypothetical protein
MQKHTIPNEAASVSTTNMESSTNDNNDRPTRASITASYYFQWTAIVLSVGLGSYWIIVDGWMMGIPWMAQAGSSAFLLLVFSQSTSSCLLQASCVSLAIVALGHVILGLGLLQQIHHHPSYAYMHILLPWSMIIFLCSMASLILEFWPTTTTVVGSNHQHHSRIVDDSSYSLLEPLLTSTIKEQPPDLHMNEKEEEEEDVEEGRNIIMTSHHSKNDRKQPNCKQDPVDPLLQQQQQEQEEEPLIESTTVLLDNNNTIATTTTTISRWNGTRRLLQLAAPVRFRKGRNKIFACAFFQKKKFTTHSLLFSFFHGIRLYI